MPIKKRKNDIKQDTVIVSLTSFPARIDKVWMTIATLLNQDAKNIKIILWLSNIQFNSIKELPNSLLKLCKKGLVIRLVDDDLRPHKKYYYAFKEFPNNLIITVDDDILYHSHLVSALLEKHIEHPNCIICNRGIMMKGTSYTKGWEQNLIYNKEEINILPTGIGGVLYPPHSYDTKHIFDIDTIKQTCLHGDDLWLSFMTRRINTKIVQTGFNTGLITTLSSQSFALCNINVGKNGNDKQITAISNWAINKFGVDFYLKQYPQSTTTLI